MEVGDLVQYKDGGPRGIVIKVMPGHYQVFELEGQYKGKRSWWLDIGSPTEWEVISESR